MLIINIIFLSISIASVSTLAWLLTRLEDQPSSLILGLLVVVATTYTLALFMRRDLKQNLLLVSVSVAIPIYLLEIGLMVHGMWQTEKVENKWANAIATAKDFDHRSKLEVLHALRANGKDAWPIVAPQYHLATNGYPAKRGRILPLGGISGVVTVNCNEYGTWAVYDSDEHGFNNPKGLYDPGFVDIALVGDSLIHGSCVGQGEDIASSLRRQGANTINLAYSGNGPLAELATIREYVAKLKPKVVVWAFYVGNDLGDLIAEKRTLLGHYLQPDFRQNLINRQSEIDQLSKDFSKAAELMAVQAQAKNIEPAGRPEFRRTVTLMRLRYRLHLPVFRRYRERDYDYLERILVLARDEVNGWGGELYFLLIPDLNILNGEEGYLGEIRATAERAGLTVINFSKTLLSHPDPLSLFPFRLGRGHFLPEGNRLIAFKIAERIRRRRLEN